MLSPLSLFLLKAKHSITGGLDPRIRVFNVVAGAFAVAHMLVNRSYTNRRVGFPPISSRFFKRVLSDVRIKVAFVLVVTCFLDPHLRHLRTSNVSPLWIR